MSQVKGFFLCLVELFLVWPFPAEELEQWRRQALLEMPEPDEDLRSLVEGCLKFDPLERIRKSSLVNHPAFSRFNPSANGKGLPLPPRAPPPVPLHARAQRPLPVLPPPPRQDSWRYSPRVPHNIENAIAPRPLPRPPRVPLPNANAQRAIEDQPWYHGPISLHTANYLLSKETDGTFLMRDSQTSPGKKSISQVHKGTVYNIRIEEAITYNSEGDTCFYIETGVNFRTLANLVKYYGTNSITTVPHFPIPSPPFLYPAPKNAALSEIEPPVSPLFQSTFPYVQMKGTTSS